MRTRERPDVRPGREHWPGAARPLAALADAHAAHAGATGRAVRLPHHREEARPARAEHAHPAALCPVRAHAVRWRLAARAWKRPRLFAAGASPIPPVTTRTRQHAPRRARPPRPRGRSSATSRRKSAPSESRTRAPSPRDVRVRCPALRASQTEQLDPRCAGVSPTLLATTRTNPRAPRRARAPKPREAARPAPCARLPAHPMRQAGGCSRHTPASGPCT